jgi:prepilin-type N-terminal cleavage/methylation domain-containing protein
MFSLKKHLARQQGMTIIELLVVIAVISILIVPATYFIIYFYGGVLKNSIRANLAIESSSLLRSVVEELRVSSGVRSANTIADANAPAGGWTTSNSSLVLIVATPVLDNSNNYVIDSSTGDPYNNEIVYFVTGNTLYKRYLADTAATGNRYKTSCPTALASAGCPPDIILSNHFQDMSFVFYDQDDAVTTTLTSARSMKLVLDMQRQAFGETIGFQNDIRITMRNSL